ncbi:MAG TPA: TlpA disulfide reductase family protein [Xanthobacteraceae bacterium]|nr:TlpA disulfide reductase family protein [Xanthobacteraceae bacterium]
MTEQSARSAKIAPAPLRKIGRLRLISAAAAAGLLVALAGIYGIEHLRSNPADAACRAAVNAGKRLAPLAHGEVAAFAVAQRPFRLPDLTFKDGQGRQRALAEWRGRTVLLNLWATWCVPCRREMPALDALAAMLGGNDFDVVAVDIDTRDPQKPLAFLKEVGATHLAYYADDSAKIFEDLKEAGKAFGMPTTVIVDRNGCELGNMAGPAEWASDDGVKLVSAAIAAP